MVTISVQASVLSNCESNRIESKNRFVSVNRIESNRIIFSPNRNALVFGPFLRFINKNTEKPALLTAVTKLTTRCLHSVLFLTFMYSISPCSFNRDAQMLFKLEKLLWVLGAGSRAPCAPMDPPLLEGKDI